MGNSSAGRIRGGQAADDDESIFGLAPILTYNHYWTGVFVPDPRRSHRSLLFSRICPSAVEWPGRTWRRSVSGLLSAHDRAWGLYQKRSIDRLHSESGDVAQPEMIQGGRL